MANMRDVAKKAGVGIATVSRYINGDGYVSDAVREKIQKAIDELNYKPNALARALFTKSSKMIGLIIPNIVNPFYPEFAIGIENRAREKGYNIVLCNTDYNTKNEKNIIEMLQQHRVDGIIAASPMCIDEYKACEIPLVSVERRISEDIIFLSSDNYRGGMLVADYIIESGLKRVLQIKGPEHLMTAAERSKGFETRLDEAGVRYTTVEGIFGEDIAGISDKLKDYEIVFVWNDDLAISLMSECYKTGLRIPEDIQVIGFDNIYYSSKTSPPLSTVSLSIEEMGEMAVDLLIRQIDNEALEHKEYIFDVEFIKRDSTR